MKVDIWFQHCLVSTKWKDLKILKLYQMEPQYTKDPIKETQYVINTLGEYQIL